MEYSAQDLSEIFGVSVRTLHYYDEIGLLAPKIRMANGRRYYGIKEFFSLTHILSLKELGFGLEKIRSVLELKGGAMNKALEVQKGQLKKKIEKLQKSLGGLDALASYYKEGDHTGDSLKEMAGKMGQCCKAHEDPKMVQKGKELEDFWKLRAGEEAYTLFRQKQMVIAEKWSKTSEEEKSAYVKGMSIVAREINKAQEKNLKPDSKDVQELIERHYELEQFLKPIEGSKEMYLVAREMTCLFPESMEKYMHPDTKKYYEFLYKAMGIFADRYFA